MGVKESIFLAKRNIVDLIWKSAKLEGLNLTFPETQTILDKGKLKNVDIGEVNTILNLKHAWQYLFAHYDQELTLEFICKIHEEVAKDEALTWGKLRDGIVGISGTDYVPAIPDENAVREELTRLQALEDKQEYSIRLMLWIMKSQLFWDGNKRTATIIANKELIKNGLGILSIRPNDLQEFNELLHNYYSYNQSVPLEEFLRTKCISTITREKTVDYCHGVCDER